MEKDNDLEQNNINKLSLERKNKLKDIISSGHKPYSNSFNKNTFANELIKKYSSLDSDSIISEKTFSLAGRLMLKRVMGKASFGTIQDQSGKIQFYISEKNVGEKYEEELFSKKEIPFIKIKRKLFVITNKKNKQKVRINKLLEKYRVSNFNFLKKNEIIKLLVRLKILNNNNNIN